MQQHEISLGFDGLSTAAAGQHAAALSEELRRELREARIDVRRENADAQDVGTILGIVLGAPSVIILANALHAYMIRKGVKVSIRTNGKAVQLSGLESKHVAEAITAAMGRDAGSN